MMPCVTAGNMTARGIGEAVADIVNGLTWGGWQAASSRTAKSKHMILAIHSMLAMELGLEQEHLLPHPNVCVRFVL